MDDSRVWGPPRYMVFLAVLALHVVLLAILVMTSRTRDLSGLTTQSLELMFLPSVRTPGVRIVRALPQRSSADNAISTTSPLLTLPSLPPVLPAADNAVPTIDWSAEAHRAAEAAANGNRGTPGDNAQSGSPSVSASGWQQPQHHVGDQFKTDTGDWVVWISSKCYQIASSVLRALTLGAELPVTLCPGDSNSPRGDLFGQLPAYKQLHPQE
jgi:hypothetical protein